MVPAFLLAISALHFCNAQPGGTPRDCGDCVVIRPEPGCNDREIQDAVCGQDQFCCDVQWDDGCVRIARICENCLPAAAANARCAPEIFYVLRHTETFESESEAIPRDDAKEVLTQEGVNRAMALAAKFFTERLPLEALFVTEEYIRSAMSVGFVASGTGISFIDRYISNDYDGLARQIGSLDPCPKQIGIVTHGFLIRGVFQALGFPTRDINTISEFGKFFELDNGETKSIRQMTFGLTSSDGNLPWPGIMPFPTPSHSQTREYVPMTNNVCIPKLFYVHRSAERYIANSDAPHSAQETLTPEGIARSFALRDKFIQEQLPLDASFVSQEFLRSVFTAAPTISETGITLAERYQATDPTNQDLATKIAMLDPCPAHVQIVSHAKFIRHVIETLGFDPSHISDIEDFGQLFILDTEDKAIIRDSFGSPRSSENLRWPGLIAFPQTQKVLLSNVHQQLNNSENFTSISAGASSDFGDVIRSKIMNDLKERIK